MVVRKVSVFRLNFRFCIYCYGHYGKYATNNFLSAVFAKENEEMQPKVAGSVIYFHPVFFRWLILWGKLC